VVRGAAGEDHHAAQVLDRTPEHAAATGIHTLFVTAENPNGNQSDRYETLIVDGPRPMLKGAGMSVEPRDSDLMDDWKRMLSALLERWVS
jgi:hypothetical protein